MPPMSFHDRLEALESLVALQSEIVARDREQTIGLAKRLIDVESKLSEKESPAVAVARSGLPSVFTSDAIDSAHQPTPHDNNVSAESNGQDMEVTDVTVAVVDGSQGEKEGDDSVRGFVEYKLSESVWDAVLVIGVRRVGRGAAALLIVAVLLNLIIQGTFCGVLMASEDFNPRPLGAGRFEDTLMAMKKWRHTEGHKLSQKDLAGVSLVSRVCANDGSLSVSMRQTTILEEINGYLGMEETDTHPRTLPLGPVLTFMCVFYYCVCVAGELRNVVCFILALLSLEKVRFKCVAENYTLIAISYRFLICNLLLGVLRVLVASSLLFVGVAWLTTTTAITDLILNTAALCFVMDLDDLLFRAVVPQTVQEVVCEFTPLKFRRAPWNMEALAPLVCILAICVTVSCTIVAENIVGMVETKSELCGGFVDFVSAKAENGIMHGVMTTPHSLVDFGAGYEVRAVQELIAMKDAEDDNSFEFMFWHRADEQSFKAGVAKDWVTASQSGICINYDDAVYASSFRSNFASYLSTARAIVDPTGSGGFSSEFTCSEYKPFCDGRFHALIRYLCPLTCGCDDATSGLLLGKVSKLGGCAMPCLQAVDAHVRKAPCSDLPVTSTAVEDKAANDGWTRYWRSFYETQAAAAPSMAREYANLTAAKMRNGCADTTVIPGTGSGFCDQEFGIFKMNGWRSIVSFCPKTCCREQMLNECPEACSPDVPS
eukprot:TRINITY_DN8736_c0_g1_i7.p1 TRINITY_DN8736_c0_g1~~TRINITY_DN8736_c0_g1_i7.p1  ORF type:complete len:741 (-),score=113.85 TRINITY_DN8736_c0_g1_i7:42-2183(-)